MYEFRCVHPWTPEAILKCDITGFQWVVGCRLMFAHSFIKTIFDRLVSGQDQALRRLWKQWCVYMFVSPRFAWKERNPSNVVDVPKYTSILNLCVQDFWNDKEEVSMCASVHDPMHNLTLTSTSLLACSRNTWAYSLTSFSLPLLAASISTNRGTLVSRKESEMWSITAFLNWNREWNNEGDVNFNKLCNSVYERKTKGWVRNKNVSRQEGEKRSERLNEQEYKQPERLSNSPAAF